MHAIHCGAGPGWVTISISLEVHTWVLVIWSTMSGSRPSTVRGSMPLSVELMPLCQAVNCMTVLCDIEGITCSGPENGTCGDYLTGCVCKGLQYGEYCEKTRVLKSDAVRGRSLSWTLHLSLTITVVMSLIMA
jgi:hypothetical protein